MSILVGSEVARARSQAGVAARRGDAEALARARGDLAAAKIESYIQRVVADAPPLTPDQKARLAALFGGVAA